MRRVSRWFFLQPIVDRYPTAKLQDLDQFKQEQVDEIGQFLLVIYALLALALVIAVIGIVNTLLLSVHERTHEIGLVRAIGMRRGQVASSVFWEALLIALIGTTIGLVVAVFFGWAVISALADEGARVFAVPTRDLVLIVVLAAVAGLMAALYPASSTSCGNGRSCVPAPTRRRSAAGLRASYFASMSLLA